MITTTRFLIIVVLSLAGLQETMLMAQSGCTDPLATNYDPNATTNDGSCVYPTTNYSLTTLTNLSTALNETSGLVMANGALWTHNDGGNAVAIYKIDSLSNTIQQTVTIGGATNVDWEDMTFDGSNFYIGDFGNNANGNRTDLKIYKFPISAIPSGANVTVPSSDVTVINFSYEDQTNFSPQGSNNTSFDCEAMIYKDGELHLFTKDWVNNISTHYSLPVSAGTYSAINQETIAVGGLVTAADVSEYGVIMLLGYEFVSAPFFWIVWDYSGGIFFNGNKRRINLGSYFSTGQIEGLCFRDPSYGYISNEKFSIFTPARLYSYHVSQWLQVMFFPVELTGFTAKPFQSGALLEWETATESNNLGFAVQRSADGVTFREIGFVAGAGNTTRPAQYRFYDPNPGQVVYYRLAQQDFDGSQFLSPIALVRINSAGKECPVTPNPIAAGQALQGLNDLPENAESIGIWDSKGVLVWREMLDSDIILPGLNPGVYHLVIQTNAGALVCRSTLSVF